MTSVDESPADKPMYEATDDTVHYHICIYEDRRK